MGAIATAERKLYEEVLQAPRYGEFSPGVKYLPKFLEMSGADPTGRFSVLDAGCATGKLGVELAKLGFDVTLTDQTDVGLCDEAKAIPFIKHSLYQKFPTTYDWVVCCDVIEHIPPQFTMLVARHMLNASRLGVFFSIATVPDVFGVWVGQPLHKTVQPYTVWRDSLKELGTVESADLLNTGLFMVTR